jgi:tRNA dimethylallyltransferase
MQSVSIKLPKCIVVSGMTGCGKSDVTRRLAARHNGVVVCGDSVQLNRGLDILTNKNNDVLLTSKYLIKDHLDANKYTIDARREILKIIEDGKTPIIDGGSWFYIKHLFTGVAEAYARCDILAEVKEISKKIIEKDTTDFFISKSRLEKLASEVGY